MGRTMMDAQRVGICTIVTKSYLPFARTLMESVRAVHPEIQRFVLLTDRIQGYLDPTYEDFTISLSYDLKIPKNDLFHFKYSVLELCTAVKAYYLEHLLDVYHLTKLIYLDPDIFVVDSLESVLTALKTHAIALTPHLTGPLDDDLKPSERDILGAGVYNLGFIGLREGAVTRAFLRWWQKRLYNDCVVDPAGQLFTDQRWIDLIPGLFQPIAVLTDPGLNAAYWNLPHRRIRPSGDHYLVNGAPLRFFHFSGFDPQSATGFSKHQNRYTMATIGAVHPLVERYRQRLLANDYVRCKPWPYTYARFSDGSTIPEVARRLVRNDTAAQGRLTGAFSPEADQQIIDYLNQPADQVGPGQILISRLAYAIYSQRADLRHTFPDLTNRDRLAFAHWILHHGSQEFGLGESLTAPIARSLHEYITPEIKGITTRAESPHFNRLLTRVLNRPVGDQTTSPVITAAAHALFGSDPELARLTPAPLGLDRNQYAAWFVNAAPEWYHLPDCLVDPVRRSLAGRSATDELLPEPINLFAELTRTVGGAFLLGWLNSPVPQRSPRRQPGLSQFAHGFWLLDADLRRRFDVDSEAGWAAYRAWFIEHASREYDIPQSLVTPVRLWAELADFLERLSLSDRAVLDFFNAPVDDSAKQPMVSLAAYCLYQSRADLRDVFPDPLGANRAVFASWFVRSDMVERDLPSALGAPMAASLGIQLPDCRTWTTDIVDGLQRSPGGRHLINWANRDYDPGSAGPIRVTRFAYYLYNQDEQARRAIPDPFGEHNQQFGRWFLSTAADRYQIPAVFLEPVSAGAMALVEAPPPAAKRARFRLPWSRPASNRTANGSEPGLLSYFQEWDVAARAGSSGGARPMLPPLAAGTKPGLNLIGYLRAPTGVGEAARRMLVTAQAVGIRVALLALEPPDSAGRSPQATRAGHDGPAAGSYPLNLLQVNADRVVETVRNLGPALMRGKYTIGYWYWELSEFLDEFQPAFACVDEVWTATSFVQDAIARKSPVPVVRIPPSVCPEAAPGVGRSHFDLPERRFLFLTMVDAGSVFERKNPLATVEAFRTAFRPDYNEVGLVLKVLRGSEIPQEMQQLRAAIGDLPVWLLEQRYEQPMVNALTACCDCTVSFHRSEGLGLTLAEAMFLGKPTIATAYSGNMDFMRPGNSLLVDYDLVPIRQTVGPYRKGLLWADPDVAHAAEQMRAVVRDEALRRRVAQRGQSFIQEHYSAQAAGMVMLERLTAIHRNLGPVAAGMALPVPGRP